MGYVDEDGYLFLLDCKDDMIITGGENVYPSRVGEMLCSHPAVKEAAVVGLPDEKWGEKVAAAVSLWPNASVTEEELIEYCKGRPAGYERPKAVFIFPELPKSSVGKIFKKRSKGKPQKDAILKPGSPGRTRTCNLRVNSPPLCLLSYRGISFKNLSRKNSLGKNL